VTEEEAFFAAIAANPDDDTPRLVYADWLEEHGDLERAEFIRLDIAHMHNASVRTNLSAAEYARQLARRAELLSRNREKWMETFREFIAPVWYDEDFTRGFFNFWNVSIPAETFVENGDRLLRATPVNELRLSAPGSVGRKLAECPHLARISNLFLKGDPPLSRADLHALLESPHAANLHTLHLSDTIASDEEFADLASAVAPGLRSLSLNGTGMTGATLPALSRLKQLECLELSCVETFDPKNLAALNSPRLRKLSFELTPVGAAGMRALAESRELTGLTTLACIRTGLNAESMEALATAAHLRLEAIWFHSEQLTTRGGTALASWPGLASVRTLVLDDSRLAGGGVAALTKSPHLGEIDYLTLSYNRMGDIGAEALARCDRLSGLAELDVQGNKITDKGVRALATARFPRLRRLQLEHNSSGEEGGKALLTSEHFNELRFLTLDEVSKSLRGRLLQRFPELHAFGAGPYSFAHGPELQALRAELAAA
jgi:uncharacterized protein (TIGR02996 family)